MSAYQEDLQYIFEYAEDDWVPMTVVSTAAEDVAGVDATFEQLTNALVTVVGDLIDRGAVPGDLLAEDPDFQAWPGSKDQMLARLRAEVQALARLPEGGEVCWIHVPKSGE